MMKILGWSQTQWVSILWATDSVSMGQRLSKFPLGDRPSECPMGHTLSECPMDHVLSEFPFELHTHWVSFGPDSVSFLWASYSVSERSVEKLHHCLFLLGRHRELERPGHYSLSEPVGIFLLQLCVTNVQQKFHRVQRVGKGNLKQENKQSVQLSRVVQKTFKLQEALCSWSKSWKMITRLMSNFNIW